MVAKVALGILLLAFVLALIGVLAYRHFEKEAERDHELEKERMEQTERLVEMADSESSLDAKLERERENRK